MTAFALKIIAAICMCLDHTRSVFPDYAPAAFRWIGRMAMPIYVYLIAESCTHTKNINRFMLRLGIFALISEIPYDLALKQGNISFIHSTNIFYTLFLGVACVNIYERLKDQGKIFALMYILPPVFLADFLEVDYGSFAVVWIFVLYLAKTKPQKLVVFLSGILYKYAFPMLMHPPYRIFPNAMRLAFGLSAFVLVCFYNGQRGKSIKWGFYFFYPAHLALLGVASIMLCYVIQLCYR